MQENRQRTYTFFVQIVFSISASLPPSAVNTKVFTNHTFTSEQILIPTREGAVNSKELEQGRAKRCKDYTAAGTERAPCLQFKLWGFHFAALAFFTETVRFFLCFERGYDIRWIRRSGCCTTPYNTFSRYLFYGYLPPAYLYVFWNLPFFLFSWF